MRRKVIKQGNNTMTVTLPKKWCELHNINQGSEIELLEQNKSLILTLGLGNEESSRAEINVSGLPDRVVRWLLSILHKRGYDEIYIVFDKDFDVSVVHEVVKDLFTGFAILEQSEKHCLLKSIAKDSAEEFENTLRRAFYVTLSLADNCYQGLQSQNYKSLKLLTQLEHTNNQLTNFCERIINKRLYPNMNDATFYYVVAWNLEKIADDYKYICDYFSEHEDSKLNKEILALYQRTTEYLRLMVEAISDFDLKKVNAIAEKKKALVNDLHQQFKSSNPAVNFLAAYLVTIVYKSTDFIPSIIALKHHQEKN